MPGPHRLRDSPWLIGVPLALGVALRIWQWTAQRSLWIDELWIAQNVRDRDLGRLLFEPLANHQVAPPGFLAAVESSTWLFGPGERSLRLVPFLMALLALFLVWRVGSRFLTGVPLAGAILLSGVSPALIWYGGEAKQYSGDVAWSLLLVLFALRHLEDPRDLRRAVWAAVLGGVALISSHAAVLTGFVIGGVLLWDWTRDREAAEIRSLAVLGAGWAIGAAIATWASLRFTTPEVRQFMRDFWAEGFAPYGAGLAGVSIWVVQRVWHVLAHYLVFLEAEAGVLAMPTALLALGALVVLLRKDRVRTLVLLAPLLAALLGGLSHILPMRNRVAVHSGAVVLLLGMAGLQALLQSRSRWWKGVGVVLGAFSIIPIPLAVLGTSRPPYRAQETRPVLATLAERLREDETVYVYCQANAAADFYGPSVGLTQYMKGGCHESVGAFLQELRALPPGRVWFFYTQRTPTRPYPDSAKAYFAAHGQQLDRIEDPYGLTGQAEASAILYRFDPTDEP